MRSQAARRDLVEIWLFSAREWGAERADTYIAEIEDAIDRVSAFPASGPVQAHRGRQYRRVRAGSHLLVYRFTDTEIRVMRVLHQRMDAARHLP